MAAGMCRSSFWIEMFYFNDSIKVVPKSDPAFLSH